MFLNMQGEIFYANDSFLKMSGHQNAEEIDIKFSSSLVKDDNNQPRRIY
ncbi:MAG: hypothetical protein ACOCXB_05685 [Halanaerobium sp.]